MHILTYSGAEVGRQAGSPSIDDIARALARVPRFGGHTRVPWTVIEHSLFVDELARVLVGSLEHGSLNAMTDSTRFRLHALLHDAHEAVIGDIPSPFKSAGMKIIGHSLDTRIAKALVPEAIGLFSFEPELIKGLDFRALLAEAALVGPPTLDEPGAMLEHFGQEPNLNDEALLAKFRMTYPTQGPAKEQWLQCEFISRYRRYRAALA